MFYLNTLTNSFVLGEKKANGTIIKQLGFPKGGLTYLIENNNVKFYLKEDYFYKNLVFSADAPLLIDGVLVPINSIPAALTKIFHQEAEGSVVDTEFNTESFNAIANSPVSIRFNEIEGVQDVISGKVDTLSGAMETKADRSEIPDVSNFIEMSDVEAYTYDKQTIDTKIENVEVDAYTKQESDARFQPIGDYLTKASGDTIYQPIGDYATRSEIPSVVGYADSVKYNSTTKYVEFYHGGTGGTKVFEYDATPFLIDGMVQNVEIINGNLVISFNTDAGKQDITIPLTDIFDPSNYYNKTEVNEAIDGVKAYFIDLDAIMSRGGLTDADWDGAIAAVNAHRPVYIKFYNNHYILESYSLDNNTMYLSASDGIAASQFTIIKNGSNDYSLNRVIRGFVTDAEKTAWDNKSDFSGDYNDLTNKPTIPTVPTNVSAFNNDAGYITSGDAASQIEEAVSGKVNTSTYNAYTAATDARIAEDEEVTAAALNALDDALAEQADYLSAHSANTTIHVTSTEKATWNNKSDFSGDYNDLTNKPTIPTVPTNVSAFNNDAGYITSGDAASQIEEAVSGKVNTSTYNTYTAATDSRLAEDEEVTAAALNALNGDIDNAKAYYISFATIATTGIRDEDWNGIVAAIDAHRPIYAGYPRNDGGILYYGVECMNKNSDNTQIILTSSDDSVHYFYTFTKNGSNDYSYTVETREYVSQAEKAAWNAKQDALVSGTNIKTINNESILGSGNIDIQGGGKEIVAGRGIEVTTGATADTVSFSLPISAGTGFNSIIVGKNNTASDSRSFAGGEGCTASSTDSFAFGLANTASSTGATAFGFKTKADVNSSFVCGMNDIANANTGDNFGSSGNTVFAVGNGWKKNDWTSGSANTHNALDIRQNGDIYFPWDTDNTTYQNYYEKPMVRLQDMYAALGGLKLVKLTQAEYDALVTKDNSTLYVIVD